MLTVDSNGQRYFNGQKMLVSYIRGDHFPRKNRIQSPFEPEYTIEFYDGPVGVCIALVNDGQIRYGFSKANIWRGDKFNREIGLNTAISRALMKDLEPPFEEVYHEDIRDGLLAIYGRAKNYYKYLNTQ